MLSLLYIENIAVIESAEIEFSPGFNVLTGETGAGKSIVIDSLNALLGARTSRELIRTGASAARVSGSFTDLSPSTLKALDDAGFSADEDGTLIISREIHTDGKNICRVCGRPATVSALRSIAQTLVSVHGQHDSRGLLDESTHLSILDDFAENSGELLEYRRLYDELADIRREAGKLKTDETEKQRRIDILKYQIEEIASARLSPGEENALEERRRMLQNSEKLSKAVSGAYEILNGDEISVCTGISDAAGLVSQVSGISESYAKLYERMNELRYLSEDVSETLHGIMSQLDFAPDELDGIERRLDLIYRLCHKYGSTTEDVLAYAEKARSELSGIEHSDEMLDELRARYAEKREQVKKAAEVLTESRAEAGKRLSEFVCRELSELGMEGARFEVSLTAAERDGKVRFTPSGRDECVFLLSANSGEKPRPLSRIASGGELSRIMLAMKNALADTADADTQVFDEIDAGVSGRAAARVGEKLCRLAFSRQVLCVTHLAQIAAFADTHFIVKKDECGGRTYTAVKNAGEDERLAELSRIIGGRDATEATMKAASEILHESRTFREIEVKDKESKLK